MGLISMLWGIVAMIWMIPTTVSTKKMPCQDVKRRICPPRTGAAIGARPFTIMRIAMKRMSSGPSHTSLAMAREMTMPNAPESPMMKRKTRNT